MSAEDGEKSSGNYKWNRTIFNEITLKECFPLAVKNVSVQKNIITRFYHYYLGGRFQKGLGVDDIVFAVLSVLPRSPYDESIIWSSKLYKDDGKAFFLTPEEKKASEVKVINQSDMVTSTEASKEASEQKNENTTEITQPTQKNQPNDPESETFEINTLFDFDHSNQFLEDSALNELDSEDYEYFMLEEVQDESTRDDTQENSFNNIDFQEDNVSNALSEIDRSMFDRYQWKSNQREYKILNYGPVENAAFVKCCDHLLSRWDTDDRSRAVLKSFFGVVALVLMRATTKSFKHLFTAFHSEKFLQLLTHCSKLGLEHYVPPHKRCLKGAYRTFRRKDGKIPSMSAKLLVLSLSDKLSKYLKYVLSNGLMNYTADYGFNLIRLLGTACSKMRPARMMKLTLCKATEASWIKLVNFMNEYWWSSDSSYRWARVLDGRFFKDVSCTQNYGLAVILAVFVEKMTGDSGVWQSSWVKNEELEKYRELGKRLYERFLAQEEEEFFFRS